MPRGGPFRKPIQVKAWKGGGRRKAKSRKSRPSPGHKVKHLMATYG
jgi:hypothetical protein